VLDSEYAPEGFPEGISHRGRRADFLLLLILILLVIFIQRRDQNWRIRIRIKIRNQEQEFIGTSVTFADSV
jgi:hypothetical protein